MSTIVRDNIVRVTIIIFLAYMAIINDITK